MVSSLYQGSSPYLRGAVDMVSLQELVKSHLIRLHLEYTRAAASPFLIKEAVLFSSLRTATPQPCRLAVVQRESGSHSSMVGD
jgi:hypothetical protein